MCYSSTQWTCEWPLLHLSIKAKNICLSVCLSVYLCLKYFCGSGSDWPESFNMAAACFKGVQLRICLDCNDTVNKLFHKCLTNSRALSTRATTVTCAPEPITAEPTATPHLKKQADLYLQRRELDRDFAGGSVPFCSVHLNWLLWINETKRVWTESVRVWGDTEMPRQQSGIGICECLCVASC